MLRRPSESHLITCPICNKAIHKNRIGGHAWSCTVVSPPTQHDAAVPQIAFHGAVAAASALESRRQENRVEIEALRRQLVAASAALYAPRVIMAASPHWRAHIEFGICIDPNKLLALLHFFQGGTLPPKPAWLFVSVWEPELSKLLRGDTVTALLDMMPGPPAHAMPLHIGHPCVLKVAPPLPTAIA